MTERRVTPVQLYLAGRTTSALGDGIVAVALPFAVIATGGVSGLSLVLALFGVARALATPFGGVWGDRLPRLGLLIACDAVRAGADVVLAVVLWVGAAHLPVYLVTTTLFGIASGFFYPASTALIPSLVPALDLQSVNARVALTQMVARTVAPGLGGILFAATGAATVFAVDALSFVVSIGTLAAIAGVVREAPSPASTPPPSRRLMSELALGWRAVADRSWLLAGLASFAFTSVGLAALNVLGPAVAETHLGGAGGWGLILTIGGGGGVIGGALSSRFRVKRPLAVAFAAWSLAALPLLGLAFPASFALCATAYALFVFGLTCGNVLWDTALQALVPTELLSRVSSWDWLASFAVMPVATVLVGPVSVRLGTGVTLIACAAIVLAGTVAPLTLNNVRRQRLSAPSLPAEPSGAHAPSVSA